MTVTLYGIKTCDTVRKARVWLDGQGVAYRFHDFRVGGLDQATLQGWIGSLGWEAVLNKASTSFRALAPSARDNLHAAKAEALMLAEPTMIKRPVLDHHGRIAVGFKPELYETLFSERIGSPAA